MFSCRARGTTRRARRPHPSQRPATGGQPL